MHFKEMLRFELRYQLRRPVFYATALGFAIFTFLALSTEAGIVLSDVPEAAHRNAPLVTLWLTAGLTALGLFMLTAFVASSVLRDFRLNTHEILFSKPIAKTDYLLGRFAGSMLVTLAIFAVALVGAAAVGLAPWYEAERMGPVRPGVLLYALLVQILPNVLAMGAIFFALAVLSRSLFATYICVVTYVCLQDYAEILAQDHLTSDWLGCLIEPLGIAALRHATRYWTLAEYNGLLPPLTAHLLANRLLWLAIGGALMAYAFRRFSYSRATARRWWRCRQPETP